MLETKHALDLGFPQMDVITVQSAGLRKLKDGTYASTLYSDRDDFGMLGGFMRVRAAQEMYWHNPTIPFVFCNGKSAKQIAKFGPDVPSDAEIYAEEFREGIAQDPRNQTDGQQLLEPTVYLEDKSVNTAASINELVTMCIDHGWKRMGLISSDYHIPRIKALTDLIFAKLDTEPVIVTFIPAETYLKTMQPGVYDAEIDRGYSTPAALERIKNEQKGCDDMAAGRYQIGEYQLAPDRQ